MDDFQRHMKAFFESRPNTRVWNWNCSTCLHGRRLIDEYHDGYQCKIAAVVECLSDRTPYSGYEPREWLTEEEMTI